MLQHRGNPTTVALEIPKLPTAPPVEPIKWLSPILETSHNDAGSSFRLTETHNLERSLEKTRDDRAKLYKKYRGAINSADGINAALIASSLGVGLLTSVMPAPIVVALESAALAGIAKYVYEFKLVLDQIERYGTKISRI